MIKVQVRQATADDVEELVARTDNPHEQRAERERFEAQQKGEALLLVARDDEGIRGRVRLRLFSKYVEIIDEFGEFPEINALDAWPQGEGVGTQIIEACEQIARERGDTMVGIAVVVTNVDARRLYERLGYEHWGDVVDESRYFDDEGNLVHVQKDDAAYLLKYIT